MSLENSNQNGHAPEPNDPAASSEVAATTPADTATLSEASTVGVQAGPQAPVQLAFSFHLTPQAEGKKIPWSKRVQLEGLETYRQVFEKLINNPPDWETRWWSVRSLRKREWPKKAMYIAWASSPKDNRQPRTQAEFAEVLGVTPQAIWQWRTENPEIEDLIRDLALALIEDHIPDVDYVTYYQAKQLDSSVSERKLFYDRYEQARNARLPMNPAQMVQLVQNFVSNINWQNLTSEQMDRIAAGEHPLLVLAANVGSEGAEVR